MIIQAQDTQDVPETLPKKVKKEQTTTDVNGNVNSTNTTPSWEYESGKNKWTKYTFEQNKELTSGLKEGKETVEINQNKATVAIVFEKMVQRNTKSGFEKRVRCLCQDDNKECKTYDIQYRVTYDI